MEAGAQRVKVRDIDIHVVRVGRGSPLVICGGPQLGHPYLRALDALSDEREVIYFDARGSGRTELGDSSQLTFAGAIDDLEGLREALGIERFSILGHSLGGHVAYLYAARHPERVESLVLVDVGPPLTEELASRLWRAMQAQRTADDDADLQRIGTSAAFQAREPRAVEDYILNIYAPFFRDRRTIPTIDLGFTEITAANVVDYEEARGDAAGTGPAGSALEDQLSNAGGPRGGGSHAPRVLPTPDGIDSWGPARRHSRRQPFPIHRGPRRVLERGAGLLRKAELSWPRADRAVRVPAARRREPHPCPWPSSKSCPDGFATKTS